MILRKNISLNEEYLKKLEPLIQKHHGNLSAVIREVIDLADAAFQDPDSVKRLISGLKKEQNLTSSTLIWSMRKLAGRLPDDEMADTIIGDIYSLSSLQKRLDELGGEIYWGSTVKINANDDRLPSEVTFTIQGKNADMNRFLAAIIALVGLKKFNLGVSRVKNMDNSFEMEMKKGEKEWAVSSITENFGYMDNAFSELYAKPDFWNTIINLCRKMDYDMVTISKPFFNDILGGKPAPRATACIERFFGLHINQIPLDDLIEKMTFLYSHMGVIEKMETDKDSLIIHHGLSDTGAIEKLAQVFVELFRLNNHSYSSEVNENLIILKHIPDVGKIFIKMLEDLKNREISFPDFHTHLVKMLDVLHNIPLDKDLIKSIGGNFGKIMIRHYEKDKSIVRWDATSFIRYLQETSAVLQQESTWELVSENIIHGKIIDCPVTENGDHPNTTNCQFIKEIIDACIVHAFGEQPERIHRECKRTADQDDFCEIYIAF